MDSKRFACKRHWIAFLLLGLLPFAGAAQPAGVGQPQTHAGKGVNKFAMELLRHLSDDSGENLIVSPQSVYLGMAMSYVASGGRTRAELARAFHFPDDDDKLLKEAAYIIGALKAAARKDRVDVDMANSTWLDTTYAEFREDYLYKITDTFGSSLYNVAFADGQAAADQINGWISKQTRDRIKEVVSPEDFASRSRPGIIDEPGIFNVNTIYFKAEWSSRFDAKSTRERPFHLNAKEKADTQFMHQRSMLLYSRDEDFKLLHLPYAGGDFSMFILLPNEILSVREILAKAKLPDIEAMAEKLVYCEVDVLLPKFTMSSQLNLAEPLKAMGVETAWDNRAADFDRMIIPKIEAYRIYLSSVYQSAWIAVDEEGTEATAATATGSYSFGCSASPKPVKFHADHPFLFFILHNESSNMLFAGWFAKPE